METDQAVHYQLDDEQRAQVRDCLKKEGLSLPPGRFERLIRSVEASIVQFLATRPQETFRDAHDALRELWEMSCDDDPAIAVLRIRIQGLPRKAVEYMDRCAPIVIASLFPTEPPITRFQQWRPTPIRQIAAT